MSSGGVFHGFYFGFFCFPFFYDVDIVGEVKVILLLLLMIVLNISVVFGGVITFELFGEVACIFVLFLVVIDNLVIIIFGFFREHRFVRF